MASVSDPLLQEETVKATMDTLVNRRKLLETTYFAKFPGYQPPRPYTLYRLENLPKETGNLKGIRMELAKLPERNEQYLNEEYVLGDFIVFVDRSYLDAPCFAGLSLYQKYQALTRAMLETLAHVLADDIFHNMENTKAIVAGIPTMELTELLTLLKTDLEASIHDDMSKLTVHFRMKAESELIVFRDLCFINNPLRNFYIRTHLELNKRATSGHQPFNCGTDLWSAFNGNHLCILILLTFVVLVFEDFVQHAIKSAPNFAKKFPHLPAYFLVISGVTGALGECFINLLFPLRNIDSEAVTMMVSQKMQFSTRNRHISAGTMIVANFFSLCAVIAEVCLRRSYLADIKTTESGWEVLLVVLLFLNTLFSVLASVDCFRMKFVINKLRNRVLLSAVTPFLFLVYRNVQGNTFNPIWLSLLYLVLVLAASLRKAWGSRLGVTRGDRIRRAEALWKIGFYNNVLHIFTALALWYGLFCYEYSDDLAHIRSPALPSGEPYCEYLTGSPKTSQIMWRQPIGGASFIDTIKGGVFLIFLFLYIGLCY
jgi:hypothetical protein